MIFLFLVFILLLSCSALLLALKVSGDATYHTISRASVIAVLFVMFDPSIPALSRLHPSSLITPSASTLGIFFKLCIYLFSFLLVLPDKYAFARNLPANLLIFSRENIFIAALYILILLSLLWSTHFETTFDAIFFGLSTTTLIAIYLGRQLDSSIFFESLKWAWTIVVVLSIAMPGESHKGWGGIIGHPNQFGVIAALSAIIWHINFVRNSHKLVDVGISTLFFALSLLTLIRTNSATSLMIFLVLFTVATLVELEGKLGLKLRFGYKTFVCFTLAVFMTAIIAAVLLSLNLEYVLGLFGRDLTFTGRTNIWPALIDAAKQRPYVGYGLGGFWQSWRGVENPALYIVSPGGWVPPNAHNGFLDLVLETGLLGLLLFFLSYIKNLRRALLYLQVSRSSEATLILIILLLIPLMNLSETKLLGSTYPWFYYILISAKLSFVKRWSEK